MPIIVRGTRRQFPQAPEGMFQAVCVDVVDLGTVETTWGPKPKVQLRWMLDLMDETGRAYLVTKRYNSTLDEKATLRADLETWRGRKFTPAEIEGFDLETLLGVNCQLQLIHAVGTNGGTYTNVQAIVPLGRNMTKIRPPADYVRVKDRDATAAAAPAEDEVPF